MLRVMNDQWTTRPSLTLDQLVALAYLLNQIAPQTIRRLPTGYSQHSHGSENIRSNTELSLTSGNLLNT
jgi:hypothetical protein